MQSKANWADLGPASRADVRKLRAKPIFVKVAYSFRELMPITGWQVGDLPHGKITFKANFGEDDLGTLRLQRGCQK
jgi:hypothetical protein